MVTKEQLGRRIKRAREEARMTQGKLGELWINKSHAAISDIERGESKVGATDLAKLAKILDKKIEYFLEEDKHQTADYLRGGREEDGSINDSPSMKKFKDFLKISTDD